MTLINSSAVDAAKTAFKTSLEAQVAPINLKIAELKGQITVLETEKRSVETLLKSVDKKPGIGRVWSAEAKQKLSIALKASAARKKEAAAAAQAAPVAQVTAPVVDNKMKAANDDSAAPAAKKAARK
jgi:hypothetical protein